MQAPAIEIVFRPEEWHDEVERYGRSAIGRVQAQNHCLKLYLPLDKEGASDAPYGFVFQLQRKKDGSPMLNFIAFGERHPDNPATRTVYERAHKRLHGRYPQ